MKDIPELLPNKRIFLIDCWFTAIICAIIPVFFWLWGIRENIVLIYASLPLLIYPVCLLLYYLGFYRAAVFVFLTGALVIIILASAKFSQFRLEGLFLLITGLSAFSYMKWRDLANFIFFFLASIAFVMIFNEAFIEEYQSINAEFDFYNKITMLIFLVLVFFKFISLILFYQQHIARFEQLNRQLRRSESQYKELLESLPCGVGLADLSGNPIFASRRATEIYGYTLEEVMQKNAFDVIHPGDHGKVFQIIENLVQDDTPVTTILRGYHKNGDLLYLEGSVRKQINDFQEEPCLLLIFDDVTERVLAQQALLESEATLKAIISSSPDVIFAFGMDNKLLVHNDRASKKIKEYFGLELQTGTTFHELLPADLVKDFEDVIPQISQGNRLRHRLDFFSTTEKKLKNYEVIISPMIGETSEPIGVVSIVRDITDTVEKEKTIQESEKRYKTLFDVSPTGIIILDIDYAKKGLECNERWVNMLESDKHSVLNGNMLLFSPEYQPDGVASSAKLKTILTAYRSHLKPKQFEWLYKTARGRLFWGDTLLSPIDWRGQVMTMMIIRDNSNEKEQGLVIQNQILELHNKNNELEKYIDSNIQLENFAYFTSHDLQTPLRTIISFTQLLEMSLENKLESTEKQYMKHIISASKNMDGFIRDLLTFSRVNTAKLNLEEVDLAILIKSVKDDMKTSLEEVNAQVIDGTQGLKIKADKIKMKQLFQNLLSNAIKFQQPDNKPTVEIACDYTDSEWCFKVKDNGIGIDPAYRDRIFLLFQRLHNLSEYEGSGIGLAICKKIVEQHGGKIEVQSTPGIGSTFHFTIKKQAL